MTPPETTCHHCGKPCEPVAGNPDQWPVRLGNDRVFHVGCVNKLLALREAEAAELEAWRALADDAEDSSWRDAWVKHSDEVSRKELATNSARCEELRKEAENLKARNKILRTRTDLTVQLVEEATLIGGVVDCTGNSPVVRGVSGKLPITKDGCIASGENDVFHPDSKRGGQPRWGDPDGWLAEFDDTGNGDWQYRPLAECYATSDAARRAAGVER